jgi:ubiquinone/menaquinone biosynthesis C-methylase UbiE
MATTIQTNSKTYVFDQAWQQELGRLRSLEDLFDPASRRHLAALGVGPGWRCLEVGCGAGSLALWLADQVGPDGHVLATDLDPRFLQGHGRTNLEARRHDLLSDPLEPASFDLVHARAVVEHVADRKRALARLAAALKPGGWLVLEDVHGSAQGRAGAARGGGARAAGAVDPAGWIP